MLQADSFMALKRVVKKLKPDPDQWARYHALWQTVGLLSPEQMAELKALIKARQKLKLPISYQPTGPLGSFKRGVN